MLFYVAFPKSKPLVNITQKIQSSKTYWLFVPRIQTYTPFRIDLYAHSCGHELSRRHLTLTDPYLLLTLWCLVLLKGDFCVVTKSSVVSHGAWECEMGFYMISLVVNLAATGRDMRNTFCIETGFHVKKSSVWASAEVKRKIHRSGPWARESWGNLPRPIAEHGKISNPYVYEQWNPGNWMCWHIGIDWRRIIQQIKIAGIEMPVGTLNNLLGSWCFKSIWRLKSGLEHHENRRYAAHYAARTNKPVVTTRPTTISACGGRVKND